MNTKTKPPEKSPAKLACLLLAIIILGMWTSVLPASAQVPTVSPEAQLAHSTITTYNGPATCIACHEQQAQQMFGSVHYQEMGETPNVPNIQGPAGKGSNGARVMNSYCGTPSTSSRATCATCHAGNGQIPSPQLSIQQLQNIDCLMCHQDQYKRVPAPPYQTITFPGPSGDHTIQAPVEDENGFHFMPDSIKMTVSVLEAARTVHLPTRASCLRCHAGAGGSDGGKRGDISSVTANPPLTSDVHMSPQGANLSCANCHSAGGHRVAGRGVDLRPNDSPIRLSCSNCHGERPHGDYSSIYGSSRDLHASHVACQTCHIPAYAKDKSTEMERSWLEAHFSMAACRGQGGWIPSEVRASNVTPIYKWFDGTSLANELEQVPVINAAGEYILALPNGSVQTSGSKIYPMKLHLSDSAVQDASGLLIPHSTFSFFTSGNFAKAVEDGQAISGLGGPTRVVRVQEYQTINHGVEGRASALQCGACHSAYSGGTPVRMNLKADLGYELKGPQSQVCYQCHGTKSTQGFAYIHDKHVRDKGIDCSSCHSFSRPERNLNRIASVRPAAPGGPVATLISDTQINLIWVDNSSTEQGFKIERSEDGINFGQIGLAAANTTSVSDTSVRAGKSYYYRLLAYNATGNSDYSQIGRAGSPAKAPAAPSALNASALSASQINLNWTDNATDEDGFVIEMSMDNSVFAEIGSVGANATSYSSAGLNESTTYYFRVRAFNSAGNSDYSNPASATTPMAAPLAPIGLNASAGDRQVSLSWNAAAKASSYNVKRSTTAGGTYTVVANGLLATSYIDNSVINGSTYYYVVSAINAGGESPASAEVSATPTAPVITLPLPPSSLKLQAGDRGTAKLAWIQSTSPNITHNKIYRSLTSSGPFTQIAAVSARREYIDSGLQSGRRYYYVVTAVNQDGLESAYSNQGSVRVR